MWGFYCIRYRTIPPICTLTYNFLRQVTFTIADQPEIKTHPQNLTTTEGHNVTLSCNAIGNPPPLISWNKDGFPIGNNSRISFTAGKKQMKITNVNRIDRGEYECVVINDIGNDTSTAAYTECPM